MKRFNVVIEGIAPLLQARHPSPEEEKEITKLSIDSSKKRKLSDQEQMEMHAYKIGKKYVQPTEMIEAAMVKAAASFKMEGKKTYKDALKGGIFLDPLEAVHEKQGFVMYAKWGVNPNTRGAVWVVRPRINEWELSFTLTLLQDERVDEKTLRDILEYAGKYVAIGAWRPKFGRFKVTKFELVP